MLSRIFTAVFMLFTALSFSQTTKYWTPDQTMKMKNITAVVPSPDGSKVLYTVREAIMTDDRSEYINQVYLCNSDGTNTIQLTKGDKNSGNPKWSNNGKWISFTSTREGKNNLYLMSIAGGEAEKISDVKTGVGDYKWSKDDNFIAFSMLDEASSEEEKNKKGKNDWYYVEEELKQNRLYVLNLAVKDTSGKYTLEKLTIENYNVNDFDWSPDGRFIAISHGKSPKVNDNVYSDISLLEIATKTVKSLAATGAGETGPLFSPDGKYIAYNCTADPVDWSGPEHVKVYEVATGKSWRLAATPDENGQIIGWTSDSKSVFLQEANRTLNGIYSLDIIGKSAKHWNSSSKDYIGIFGVNATGSHAGFVLQNTSRPGEAFISTTAAFSPQKISNIHAALANYPVPRTEVIKWKSFDGKEIEGLLTYPLNYLAGKKYPLILNIHGGPAGVFNQSFVASNTGSYPIAALAEMGIFVLRPNPRGSSGYGADFRMANRKDWGGGDYKDLMAGVDYVLKMNMIDENNMGVMGWSYGGFMSSWVVGHTDRFKAASIGAPVVDLAHQNLTDDIAGFLPSYMQSEPWNDWATYDKWSPLRYVQNVKTPVLLQHCEGDQRVPISNAIMFFNALKRRNVPVRMLAMPRQSHGPVEPKMSLITMQSNIEWMGKYLLGITKP
jgi:dipeptidyl aminopeptidase/acylaminoacyl peptidase